MLLTSGQKAEEVGEHDTGEGEEMKRGQSLYQPFIVSGQATEARGPGKAALHHPAARQQDETALGLGGSSSPSQHEPN